MRGGAYPLLKASADTRGVYRGVGGMATLLALRWSIHNLWRGLNSREHCLISRFLLDGVTTALSVEGGTRAAHLRESFTGIRSSSMMSERPPSKSARYLLVCTDASRRVTPRCWTFSTSRITPRKGFRCVRSKRETTGSLGGVTHEELLTHATGRGGSFRAKRFWNDGTPQPKIVGNMPYIYKEKKIPVYT